MEEAMMVVGSFDDRDATKQEQEWDKEQDTYREGPVRIHPNMYVVNEVGGVSDGRAKSTP